jgi:hypothetical protein
MYIDSVGGDRQGWVEKELKKKIDMKVSTKFQINPSTDS